MTDCILHTGCTTKGGYGLTHLNGKTMLAHRVAYIKAKGAVPDGMVIMHTCDTPLCVNPEHLKAGTQRENRIDCVTKGRANPAKGEKHYGARLTEDIVREIRTSSLTNTELAKVYGIPRRTISDARRGKTWRHI
ncbi:HNH homing endonuclease [Escherichia phage vB_Ec_Tarrare]|uniref:HNH homing endonuclease n=1 Tax=Escherichia phage vB_Ec_Tarrare TaxID=3032379 RepID=A0AAF0D4F3_9CAUD|nr:HNH homing endonuclease [Escherichia phage vB_Ec_Tarrare]